MVRHTWIIGALAAALWMSPAAAQTGSTSQGNEHAYAPGNGTDVTRSNTDTDEAPATSREYEQPRSPRAAGTPSGNMPASPQAASTGSGNARSGNSARSNGNNQQSGASPNYPYSR